MRKYPMLIFLVLLLILTAAGVAWAQKSSAHDLSWNVVSAGGREGMSSGSHTAHGTLSQLAIGPIQSGQHAVGSGYWYGIRPGGAAVEHRIYLPVVMKNA